ncbi:MAG TPA: hypothetical protein DD473_08685 [Planctomycetaceae bacterium]|nr:hypothetical protein [Planctomycetaceae bacterium]
MSSPSKVTSFSTSIILTAGLAIFYAVVVMWISILIMTYLFPQKENHSQRVTALIDGTVLIYHSIWHPNYSDNYYTTLDGEKYKLNQDVNFSTEVTLTGGNLDNLARQSTSTRSISISSFNGKEEKSLNWYFIYKSKFFSTGYFVAYHPISKQVVHYLGQNGFQKTIPDEEFQFPIYGTQSDIFGKILILDENYYSDYYSYATIPKNDRNQSFQREDLLRDSGLLLTRDGAVQQINFLTGEIQTFLDRKDILDMALTRLSLSQLPADWSTSDRKSELGVIFRTADSVYFYGLEEEKTLDVTIPKDLQKQSFSVQFFEGEQILYQVSEYDKLTGKYAVDLYWSDYPGKISQTKDDLIVRYNPQHFHQIKWLVAGVQPAPLSFLSFMLIAPVEEIKSQYRLTTTGAVLKLLQMSLPVLVVLIIVSTVILLHYRHYAHQKRITPHWWEYAFILLMGPFAYLILRWSLKSPPELTPQTQRDNSIEILRPLLKPVS